MVNDMSGLTVIRDPRTKRVSRTLLEQTGVFISGIAHHGANSAYWNDDYLVLGGKTIKVFNDDYELLHE